MLTKIIIFVTIISSLSCATVNEVVEAYGAELGLLQRTAHPSPKAKIDFFSRFNQFLPIEKQLETLGDTSYEQLIDALIQIQQARIRLDAVYCEGDLCDLDLKDHVKMFKPGFDYRKKTFPTQAGDITLPEALRRLQEAQEKILQRKFPSCAVGQMRLFAESNKEIWEPVKISYRVAHPALNPKMDFPAWPIACSEFVQAGNEIPNTFKPHRKKIRRLCGQKIEFESAEWEFEQTTVTSANKKAFAKCWIRTSTRRWFMDAIQNPDLIENYPGIFNSGCHDKKDYLCKQIKASQPKKDRTTK